MIDLLRLIVGNGGLIVVLIGLASMVAVTVVLERCWRLLPLRRRFAAARAACNQALLSAGPREAISALSQDEPMSRVLRAGLQVHERGGEMVLAAARNAAQREVAAIERGLTVVQMAAQVAPWLGLLGTVVGLMEVFQRSSTAATLTNAVVADGIYKALASTVAGLALAISAYLAYGLLSGLANRLVDDLENAAADLPIILRAP